MVLLDNFVTITKCCLKLSNTNKLLLTNVRSYCAAVSSNATSGQAAQGAAPAEPLAQRAQKQMQEQQQQQQQQLQRALHVAVIGVPNAGKSTFINNLINHRVCPTSCKVHTTRKANKAIYTTGNTQLVFYDTPGLVTTREIKKHNLEQSFKTAYRKAIQHADVIAVIHDVSNSWTRNELHSTVVDTLKAYPTLPSFLVLNKIDVLKSKRVLLDLIRMLTNEKLHSAAAIPGRKQKSKNKFVEKERPTAQEAIDGGDGDLNERKGSWSHFQDVFMVSSVTGNGLSDMHEYLVGYAKERPWQYASETFTDETPEALIVDSVRARLLDYLPQEIPYNLQSVMEYYSVENGTIYASVLVMCPSARIERLICGESNGKLRQITERVTSDLVETFGQPISLTIATRAKKEKD